MQARILDTEARRKSALAQDRANNRLVEKGWKHDGLWWISPHSQLRYSKREALGIEEIRAWGESDSAFLNDKDHSMWVKKEIDDNKLTSMDELAQSSKQRTLLKQRAVAGCYSGSVK